MSIRNGRKGSYNNEEGSSSRRSTINTTSNLPAVPPGRSNGLGSGPTASFSSSASSSPIPTYSQNGVFDNGSTSGNFPADVSSITGNLPFPFRQPFQPSTSTQSTNQIQQGQQNFTMERFTADLTNCIIAFLSPILPTEEEYRIKEATRRQLERLTGKVSPGARLLAFGSMANGFALKNSDMDLCCLLAQNEGDDTSSSTIHPNASQLVEELGKLLREETDYNVMPLPKARIPIIKISKPPTVDLPYEISCDIGFENRLALENTRLLLSYAMVDPPRLRTLVLFLKVWTKRRKLNSPYTGTLSSYGYTLMMLFFLVHVKRPAVLPNLQRIPPSNSSSNKTQDVSLNGHNVYFYDDVATLRREWTSYNHENVGELLLDFFKYFSKEFGYSRDVISIRTETGVISKDNKLWNAEFCIEDPFQSGYNVARTVTKDGLYTIRGEFMRASRILTTRTDRVSASLAELCEEREDGLTRAPDPSHSHRPRPVFYPTFLNPALYLPTGGFDPRYLRDLTRRFEAGSLLNNYGGSFAFEEMARGLAQAQQGGTAMAYPPTTAMLAPLSQNVGLSPRQNLMRAGLRYETPRRGQSVAGGSSIEPTASNKLSVMDIMTAMPSTPTSTTSVSNSMVTPTALSGTVENSTASSTGLENAKPLEPTTGKKNSISIIDTSSLPRAPSSARSDDGGASAYERRKSTQRWNASFDRRTGLSNESGPNGGNASARTSPRMDNALSRSLLHPSSAASVHGSYGVGEAFAYGTEISFGSQRFQLYPQSPKQANPHRSKRNPEDVEENEEHDDDGHVSFSGATMDDEMARVSINESSLGGEYQRSDGEHVDSDIGPFDDDSDGKIVTSAAATTTTTEMDENLEPKLSLMTGSEPLLGRSEVQELHVGKEHDVRSWAASQREQLNRQRSAS